MNVKKINESLINIKNLLSESEPLMMDDQKNFKSEVKKETLKYIQSTLIKDLGKISDKVISKYKFKKDDTVFINGIGSTMLSDYIYQVIHDEIYLVRPSRVPTFND